MAKSKGGKADPKAAERSESTATGFKSRHVKNVLVKKTKKRVSSVVVRGAIQVMVYLINEIASGAALAAKGEKKKKIQPKHINSAIGIDNELSMLGKCWLIKNGGLRKHSAEVTTSKKKKTASALTPNAHED